jgi:hypothetical protein
MPNIKPFRQYDEHDVINLFTVTGVTLPLSKGTLMKISVGWKDSDNLENLGAPGEAFPGTVSQRYGVASKVTLANTGDVPLGMTLYDVREVDENGEKLLYHPRKMHEMQAVLSGWPVPLLTKGLVLYSGVTGTVNAGDKAYVDDNGIVNVIQKNGAAQVGKFLGGKNTAGYALLKLEL